MMRRFGRWSNPLECAAAFLGSFLSAANLDLGKSCESIVQGMQDHSGVSRKRFDAGFVKVHSDSKASVLHIR